MPNFFPFKLSSSRIALRSSEGFDWSLFIQFLIYFIFDVNYELLVQSPEDELKKIFSFCNLTWDPNCLNFYKSKKTPISTVSVNQASKPIYKSSVNSNEGFSKYLTEMFHILDTKK